MPLLHLFDWARVVARRDWVWAVMGRDCVWVLTGRVSGLLRLVCRAVCGGFEFVPKPCDAHYKKLGCGRLCLAGFGFLGGAHVSRSRFGWQAALSVRAVVLHLVCQGVCVPSFLPCPLVCTAPVRHQGFVLTNLLRPQGPCLC